MKVTVISASPFMRKGLTSIITSPFISGMRSAGADIRHHYIQRLDIKPCRGDLSCWFKLNNRCIQNDDMKMLYPDFKEADMVVFSFPVYCDGVPGQLKNVMDRLIALGTPYMEIRNNHMRHPSPQWSKNSGFAFVSSCGLWERDNFDPVTQHLKAFCRNINFRYCGRLIRPHSFALKDHSINNILKQSKTAGRELIENHLISSESEKIISKDIVSRKEYEDLINRKADTFKS